MSDSLKVVYFGESDGRVASKVKSPHNLANQSSGSGANSRYYRELVSYYFQKHFISCIYTSYILKYFNLLYLIWDAVYPKSTAHSLLT